jgi:glycosyltransferase involved in cell wall biosynthesis
MKNRLAIIIPAYKVQFLVQALESVARQTSKDFTLYIGDDASSDDLEQVVKQFEDKINLVYHRFENNVGSIDLIEQWTRSVNLSVEEDYIWLFSDDDIMPIRAVESFYEVIAEKKLFDLYRFNIDLMDERGAINNLGSSHPDVESAEDFILKRLKCETLSSACEYIFSRSAFIKAGGFVKFPLAWGSDDATWYKIGKNKGICTIPGDPVHWRLSGINITSLNTYNKIKFKASLLYFKWLKSQHVPENIQSVIPAAVIQQSVYLKINAVEFSINLINILRLIGTGDTFYVVYVLIKRRLKLTLRVWFSISHNVF